jgi:quinol monooxygenase YgiN
METTTVQMFAELRAKPEHAEDVAALVKTFADHVRRQPGCERIEIYRRTDAPETFFAIISFVDEESFAAHLDDQWRQVMVQRAGAWLAERPRRHTMQRLV